MQSNLVYLPLLSALPCAKLITCILHTYMKLMYLPFVAEMLHSLFSHPLLHYSSILCNLECPPSLLLYPPPPPLKNENQNEPTNESQNDPTNLPLTAGRS